jgi:hypothetical protein
MANRHQKRRANRKAKKKAEKELTTQRVKDAAPAPAPRLTHLQRFIRDKLRLETEPFEVDIGIQGTTLTAKKCHVNCEKIVAAAPYMEMRTCWIVDTHTEINCLLDHFRDTGVISQDRHAMLPRARVNDYEAEFHSILLDTRTGTFYDPTKDMVPSRTRRTVILEPRMSTEDWLKYCRQAPENICTDRWCARSTPAEEQPDFFNLVAEVNMIKNFAGTVLFTG